MSKAIFPGTFDPMTNGHLDVIRRAASIFDTVVVGLLTNIAKNPLFTVEERMDMIKEYTADLPNVEVVTFSGLLMNFAIEQNANVILRGSRTGNEFELELMNAHANKMIYPSVETIIFPSSPEHACISSSMVREVAYFDGDIRRFVPDSIADKLYARLAEQKKIR